MVSLTNPFRNFKRTDLSLSRFMVISRGILLMLMLILLKVTILEVLTIVEGLVTILRLTFSESRLNIDDRRMVLLSTHSLHHTQSSNHSASVSSFSVPVYPVHHLQSLPIPSLLLSSPPSVPLVRLPLFCFNQFPPLRPMDLFHSCRYFL